MSDNVTKKKVVFFIGGLNFGGMERVVFIACELLKNSYDVSLVTLYRTNADYEVNIPIYDLNVPPKEGKINKIIGFIKRLHRTRIMKKKIEADVVFSFGMYSNYLNALTKGKEKIIMGIRSYDWLTNAFTIPVIDRFIISKFDSVNSVSKLIACDAEKYWKIPQKRNMVIYNPYDINMINQKALETIDDFAYRSDCFYFITMGRLADQKGYNHLVHSFSRLYDKYKNVRLIIMGDGNRKNILEELIREYDLENVIFLVGGKNNPYKYIKKANCYVLSSHSEGFPNAMVEAMSLGKIVIAANCQSGPSEILMDKVYYNLDNEDYVITDYGILTKKFEWDDNYVRRPIQIAEESLCHAMEYVYKNELDLSLIKINSKKRASEFDYDSFQKKLISEISGVIVDSL